MYVREVMQRDVVTATPAMSLTQAERLMHTTQIRHLPVVVEARVIGMVTDRDIREATPSPATTLSVGEIRYQMHTIPLTTCMTREVVTLQPDDDLVQAARVLTAQKFGCLPVVDEGRLVGLLTEIDVLRAVLQVLERGERHVRDAMQTPMITVTPEDLVRTALHRMQGGRVRHLPVVDETDMLVGVITDRDIRRAGASDDVHLATHELPSLLEKVTVSEVMTRQVQSVREDTSLVEAGWIALTHKFGCIPVCGDNGTLVGMLTVTDLLRLYVEQHHAGEA